MYDPFGLFGDPDEERRRLQSQAAAANPLSAAAAIPPMAKPEAEGLLSRVADTGLGAMHYIGSTIDKTFGGRAIRGLLGGKPHELLSVLPGSDTFGLTDERDRVSGEDLLEKAGVLQGGGEKGTFEFRDLLGPAAELALDPSTYLTLGTGSALTAAGRAAKDAGLLPAKATARLAGFAAGTPQAAALAAKMAVPEAEVAGRALSGLAGVGLPFSHPSAVVGTGDAARRFAGWLEDKAQSALYGRVGTTLSRIFDPAVNNTTGAAAQKAAREVYTPAVEAGHAQALGQHLDLGRPLEAAGLLDHARKDELRLITEGINAAVPGSAEHAAYDAMKARNAARLEERAAVGLNPSTLADDYAEYGHRQMTLSKDTRGYAGGRLKGIDPSSPAELARQEVLKDIPRGTVGVNEIAKDANVRAFNDAGQPLLAAQEVRRTHLGMTPQDEQRLFALRNAAPASLSSAEVAEMNALQATWKKAEHLASWNGTLDPQFAANGWDFFGNHPLTDFTLGEISHRRSLAGAEALHSLIAGNTVAPGQGTITAAEALRRVGLDHQVLNNATGAVEGGPARLLEALKAADPKYATASVRDLAGIHVPESLIDDASRFAQVVRTPEAVAPLVKAWDSITNLTKAGQTSLWPSFHTRNFVTGLWQNLVGGARDPRYHALDPRAWLKPYQDAMAIRNNGVVEGAAEIFAHSHPGITDAEATRLISEGMFQHGARVSAGSTQAAEAIGRGTLGNPVPLHLPGSGNEVPVAEALNPARMYRDLAARPGATLNPLDPKSMLSPLNVRGVGGADETGNILVKYGQQLGGTVDDLNRMSAHVAYLRQGVDPAQAALRSKGLHFDFSKLTDVEREVLRRVIPFYSWTRKNVPFQVAELAQRPGGVAGSAVKGLDSLRAQEGFVPDSVSEGMAIPVGTEGPDGTARFLTHLGIPVEDAFSFLGTGQSPITRTGEKLLGMANPIIKMPAELIANKQFYSGRALDDLYSRTGNPILDQVLMNSPASRLLTTGGQLADPRKGLLDKVAGLVGPAKVADVDMDKARQVAARDYIDKSLKAGNAVKSFETLYVPPDQVAQMSPEEVRLYQLYKYMERQRVAQNKAAKQGAR